MERYLVKNCPARDCDGVCFRSEDPGIDLCEDVPKCLIKELIRNLELEKTGLANYVLRRLNPKKVRNDDK